MAKTPAKAGKADRVRRYNKQPRRISPEQAEAQTLAAQVMQMMGEVEPDVINDMSGKVVNPRLGVTPHASNAAERAAFKAEARDPASYGGDGSLQAQTGYAIDDLGDAALTMGSAELMQALGFNAANASAVEAFDKLTPEERIELIRAMHPMDSFEGVASRVEEQGPEAVLRQMGVE